MCDIGSHPDAAFWPALQPCDGHQKTCPSYPLGGFPSDLLTWIVQTGEKKGQVDLAPHEAVGLIEPMYALKIDWIRLKLPQLHEVTQWPT